MIDVGQDVVTGKMFWESEDFVEKFGKIFVRDFLTTTHKRNRELSAKNEDLKEQLASKHADVWRKFYLANTAGGYPHGTSKQNATDSLKDFKFLEQGGDWEEPEEL